VPTLKASSGVLNQGFPIQSAQPFNLSVGHNQPSSSTSAVFAKTSLADRTADNLIFAGLATEDKVRLSTILEPVYLSQNESLSGMEGGECFVHFPESAIISQLSLLYNGTTVEVAMIGREGVAGLGFLFNSYRPELQTQVAIAGAALRMRAKDFKREFDCGGAFRRSLLRYAGDYVEQVSRRAGCNARHQIEAQLACRLLMLNDRTGGDLLPLTHDQIANCLGTRRASITVAAGALQDRRLITYYRGWIKILDRHGLEYAACECYQPLSDPFTALQEAKSHPGRTQHAGNGRAW
jgi:CRP-like cAMP-binding protein